MYSSSLLLPFCTFYKIQRLDYKTHAKRLIISAKKVVLEQEIYVISTDIICAR